jgi:hypothetical protein
LFSHISKANAHYVAKLLPLIPLSFFVYYRDIQEYHLSLYGAAYLLTSTLLFFFSLFSKRKILLKGIEISKENYLLGSILFLFSGLLYVTGSYTKLTNFFHFESFLFFVLSYTAFRFGSPLTKKLFGIMLFLSFSFSVTLLPLEDFVLYLIYSYSSIVFLLVLFRFEKGYLILPLSFLLIFSISLAYPFIRIGSLSFPSILFIPTPIIPLLYGRTREKLYSPIYSGAEICKKHEPDQYGLCFYCSKNVDEARVRHGFGFWGLFTVLVASLILSSTNVYGLILTKMPYEAYFSYSGSNLVQVPVTPEGWQLNYSLLYTNSTNTFLGKYTFVPKDTPEIKNYTLYYALSPYYASLPITQGEIPGWKRLWLNNTEFGGFQGYLAAYTNNKSTMLIFEGKTTLSFITNGTYQRYYSSVGIDRVFKNTNLSSNVREFRNDITSLWGQSFARESNLSLWTDFLVGVSSGLEYYSDLILTIISSTALIYLAYRFRFDELKIRNRVEKALLLEDDKWKVVSRILSSRNNEATSKELLESIDLSKLKVMERDGLIRRAPSEFGSEPVGVWKLS